MSWLDKYPATILVHVSNAMHQSGFMKNATADDALTFLKLGDKGPSVPYDYTKRRK